MCSPYNTAILGSVGHGPPPSTPGVAVLWSQASPGCCWGLCSRCGEGVVQGMQLGLQCLILSPAEAEARSVSQPQPSSPDGCWPPAWPGTIAEEEGESLPGLARPSSSGPISSRACVMRRVHLPSWTQLCTPGRACHVPPSQFLPGL